jgi:hypothetical protein
MGVYRLTLSITDELKDRMDVEADVNWSSVARDAFEAKLKDIRRDRRKTRELEKRASVSLSSAHLAKLKALKQEHDANSRGGKNRGLGDQEAREHSEEQGRKAAVEWAAAAESWAQIEEMAGRSATSLAASSEETLRNKLLRVGRRQSKLVRVASLAHPLEFDPKFAGLSEEATKSERKLEEIAAEILLSKGVADARAFADAFLKTIDEIVQIV